LTEVEEVTQLFLFSRGRILFSSGFMPKLQKREGGGRKSERNKEREEVPHEYFPGGYLQGKYTTSFEAG